MAEKLFQTNIDRNFFNRIGNTYLKKDLHLASRLARKLRLTQTLRLVPNIESPKILEIGCGAGFSAEYLSGWYQLFHGVDYSDALISYAIQNHGGNKVAFFCKDAMGYKADIEYDVVLMIGVLHHSDNPIALLQHALDLVGPHGWVIVNEPQQENPIIRWARNQRQSLDKNYSSDQSFFYVQDLLKLFLSLPIENIRLRPQGIFSTPFAEVLLPFPSFFYVPAWVSCFLDRWIESVIPGKINKIAWNLVVAVQKGNKE